ncbi:hypothetical protein BT69DRAFT_910343 [Atractiella rhizophila]|nr:hypothetical protein BT69DRAFT_910343 [Atractiella rhizophila]
MGFTKELEKNITTLFGTVITEPEAVQDPFKDLERLLDLFFFPKISQSVIIQIRVLQGLFGILFLVAVACTVVRISIRPFHFATRNGTWILPNTPVLFSGLVACWLFAMEIAMWKQVNIYEGKQEYKNNYILRSFTWSFLFLAAFFKGYGVIVASSLNSHATHVGLLPPEGRPCLKSILTLFGIPLTFIAYIIATHVYATLVCNGWLHRYLALKETLIGFSSNLDVDTKAAMFSLLEPLSDFNTFGDRCVVADRVISSLFLVWYLSVFLLVRLSPSKFNSTSS